jgi:hypothetical protein
MAVTVTSFQEDGTTELTFSDGRVTRVPSALLYDVNGNPLITNPATGQAGAGLLATAPVLWNGTTFDPEINNQEMTYYASAARTATPAMVNQKNYNQKGVAIYVNVTAAPASAGALTPKLYYVDPVAGNTFRVWTVTNAISYTNGVSPYIYVFYPGVSNSAATFKEFVNLTVPRTFAIQINHSTSDSWTYSVSYCLID